MNSIEAKISEAKLAISAVTNQVKYGRTVDSLPADAKEIGQGESIFNLSALSTGLYQDTAGTLYTALPHERIFAMDSPNLAAKAIAAVATIKDLRASSVAQQDVIATAMARSEREGQPVVVRYGTKAAIECDAAHQTMVFAWRSPAGYDDDPMSFGARLLGASEEYRYNEETVASTDREKIEQLARKLRLSLTEEVIVEAGL